MTPEQRAIEFANSQNLDVDTTIEVYRAYKEGYTDGFFASEDRRFFSIVFYSVVGFLCGIAIFLIIYLPKL